MRRTKKGVTQRRLRRYIEEEYVYARTDCSLKTTDSVQTTLPKNVPTLQETKGTGGQRDRGTRGREELGRKGTKIKSR
jgi:hypothetical protein